MKLPLALLAALAMLLLWSGPASAGDDPATDLLTGVGEQLEQLGTQPTVVPESPDQAADQQLDVPAGTVVELPPVLGDAGAKSDAPAPDPQKGTAPVTAPTTTDPADDLAAGCADLLDQLATAGVPATVDCGAVLQCLEKALPGDLTLEGLGQLPEADATEVLDGIDLDALLACVQSAVVVTPPTGTTTPPTSTPQPVLQPAASETYYQNCDDARARGAAPVYAGQPGYRAGLDSDSDGIGCEASESSVQAVSATTTTQTASGRLAYTGFELTPVLLTAAALLAVGGGLLLGTRRRS